MQQEPTMRVVIADDQAEIREALHELLELHPRLTVIGAGAGVDADDAIRLCAALRPEVVVLDLKMPGGGVHAATTISATQPETTLVCFTSFAEPEDRAALDELGIPVLLKGSGIDLAERLVELHFRDDA